MTRLARFCIAAGAALAAYGLFFARHPMALTDHYRQYGILGVASAAAMLVLVASLAGCLALAARAGTAWRAALHGLVLPALACLAALPIPDPIPGGSLNPKQVRALASLSLIAAPVRVHATAAHADDARALKRAKAELVAAATAQDEAKARLAAVTAEGARAKDEACARLTAEAAAARDAAVARAVAETEARAAAAQAAAVAAAQAAAATEREAALASAAEAAGRERDGLAAQLAEAQAATRSAVVRAGEAERDAAEARRESTATADLRRALQDWRRLAAWFETTLEVPQPTLTVLGRKLASRDPEERQVAARLLGEHGAVGRPLLRKAMADANPAVRREVEAALGASER